MSSDPVRKAAVVLHLTVVVRRTETADNGPAQSVDALRQAVSTQLNGALLEVQEFPGRPAADYELTVANARVAGPQEQARVLHALGLDADGRPKHRLGEAAP